MHIFRSFLVLLLFILNMATHAATLPAGFTEKRLATGLNPTGMAILPDGRVLVSIKSGNILLIKNDVVQTTSFFTVPNVDSWNERGLLSLIIDPNFATNQYVYAYYTYKNTSTNISNNRVSRFTASGDRIIAGSEVVLINFNNLTSAGYHNGGGLVFGADGKLYASTGENTNSAYSQSLTTLLGKVLRINPDGTIPTDNPFYTTTTGQNRAIYALGFRNPFRMKLQNSTGKIYANDVGAGSSEEINEIKPGRNYGWPRIEGKRTTQAPPSNYEDPVYAYGHTGNVCSITGGAFYNPAIASFPAQYVGKYFFMDYCAGWIRYIDPANNDALSNFATGLDRGLDIEIDNTGNMYYLARGGIGGGSDADNTSSNEGELWRISYSGSGNVAITVNPQSRTVAAGASVTFSTSASGTAPITYQWKRNGVNIPGATSSTYTIPAVTAADNGAIFTVTVANNTSTQTSTAATLTVIINTAPVVQITSPTVGTLYEGGTAITFSGTATDREDGTLPATAYTWRVDFHHNLHNHPGLEPTSGLTRGTFVIPDEGETSDTVWYRIYLTATDAAGTRTTVSRDIYPRKVEVTLITEPAGIPLRLDGRTITTPYKFTGVVGIRRSIEAENLQRVGNTSMVFSGWSNGGEPTLDVITPSVNTTYLAKYEAGRTDTLSVVADAYVRGGTGANTAFGTTDPLQLHSKYEISFELTRQTYLRFDLTQVPIVSSAELRLYGKRNSTENTSIRVSVYGVNNQTWNENTLTWNNKPAADTALNNFVDVTAAPAGGQYYAWDVSAYVKRWKLAGAASISFALINTDATTSYAVFNSKEAGANKPQLVISSPSSITGTKSTEWFKMNVNVFPNPTTGLVKVECQGDFEFTLLNLAGTELLRAKANGSYSFENNGSAGVYVLKIKSNEQQGYIKLIKN